uniref:Immunoglobulin domain-containing protein n=1 Tax=Salarias fasciatus TaxID=181472 RepID=A0A672HJA5_SALFA
TANWPSLSLRLLSVHTDACFPAVLTEGTTIRVEGVEGGSVSFQCSHRLAWGYNKYFCVDPCESSSSVLVTVAPGKQAASGRIALMDSGNGVFTVTFSQLRLSDSHKYFCGVERTAAIDTYVTVYLTVREGKRILPELVNFLFLLKTHLRQISAEITQSLWICM